MKLEVGKFYRCRDGRKAYVAGRDPFGDESAYPLTGFVVGAGAQSWTDDGAYFTDKASNYDLVAEWVEPAAKHASGIGRAIEEKLSTPKGAAEYFRHLCACSLDIRADLFDIADALDPTPPAPKFRVGDRVRLTASPDCVGRVVDGNDGRVCNVQVRWENEPGLLQWEAAEQLELAPEPKRVRGWCNVGRYPNGELTGGVYDTREDAERNANDTRIACIYIDAPEGAGL